MEATTKKTAENENPAPRVALNRTSLPSTASMQSYTDWLPSTNKRISLAALDIGSPAIEFDREATLFEDDVVPTMLKELPARKQLATTKPTDENTDPSPQPKKKPVRSMKKQTLRDVDEDDWQSDNGEKPETDDEVGDFLRALGRGSQRVTPVDEWTAFGLRYRTDDFRPSHGGTFPAPDTGARIPPSFVESAAEVANRETKAAFWAAAADGNWPAAERSLRRLEPRVLAFPLGAIYKSGITNITGADGQLRARLASFAAAHGYTLALADLRYFRFTLHADAHEAWRFPPKAFPVPGTRAKLALARRVRAEDGRRVFCAGEGEVEMVLTDASMMREPPGKASRKRELHKRPAVKSQAATQNSIMPKRKTKAKAKPLRKTKPQPKSPLEPPSRQRQEFPDNECLEGLRARYVYEHEYRRTAILLWKSADHGAVLLEHMGAETVMRNIAAGIAHAHAGSDLELPTEVINEALDMSMAPGELWHRIHAKDGQRLLREAVLEWARVSQTPKIAEKLESLWSQTQECESSGDGEDYEEDHVANVLEDEANDPVFHPFAEGIIRKMLEAELNDPLFHAALYEGMWG